MRCLSIALVCTGLALGGAGCFAFEEIDQGQEIMDQHFAGKRKAEEEKARRDEATRAPEEPAPGLVARVQARVQSWWSGSETDAPEPSGPPPHPDNVPGRCEIDGSTQFMRKFDCQLRGGTYVPSESRRTR